MLQKEDVVLKSGCDLTEQNDDVVIENVFCSPKYVLCITCFCLLQGCIHVLVFRSIFFYLFFIWKLLKAWFCAKSDIILYQMTGQNYSEQLSVSKVHPSVK